MEIKAELGDSKNHDERRLLLLGSIEIPSVEQNMMQKAISQTFRSTAHLANFLPTGSVLAFQLLSPIFTNLGNHDPVSRFMTNGLVALCGASCFLLSFTDSFRDNKGNISYGLTTFKGLWVIDGSITIPPQLAAKYRLQVIDFMHAIMSIMVFAAVALF